MTCTACFVELGSFAQIDPDDACGAGVPSLTVETICTPNNYTLPGTFTDFGTPSCGAGNRDDGWYQFTATGNSTGIQLTGNRTKAVSVYTDPCGGTLLACDRRDLSDAATVAVETTPGTTYYIQVHRKSGSHTADMTGTICVYSLIEPGDIGVENLTAWFRANDLASGDATSWATTFPVGVTQLTVTDPASPYSQTETAPTNGIFNYNNVVSFEGNAAATEKYLSDETSNDLLLNNAAGDTGTYFIVFASRAGTVNNQSVNYYLNGATAVNCIGMGELTAGTTLTTNGTRTFSFSERPFILPYTGNNSTATSMDAFFNDAEILTTASSSISGSTGFSFGARYNVTYSDYFDGYIAEVIYYNKDLIAGDYDKVNTYLALKYGVTLDNSGGGTAGDYVNTDDVIIWDASDNSGYHNDVIGIGNDVAEGLTQKQSHQYDDSTRVYLGTLVSNNADNTSSFTNNLSYLMMGHDNGKICATAASNADIPIAAGLFSRLEREWKVTATNFPDSFNWDVELNSCAVPVAVTPSHLRLLVDDDGDFTDATVYDATGGLSFSYSGGVITVSGISNTHIADNSTAYITIGSTDFGTPLPINLTNFTADLIGDRVEASWITESEVNNDYFLLHRSQDLENWEEIARIDGARITVDMSGLANGMYYITAGIESQKILLLR